MTTRNTATKKQVAITTDTGAQRKLRAASKALSEVGAACMTAVDSAKVPRAVAITAGAGAQRKLRAAVKGLSELAAATQTGVDNSNLSRKPLGAKRGAKKRG